MEVQRGVGRIETQVRTAVRAVKESVETVCTLTAGEGGQAGSTVDASEVAEAAGATEGALALLLGQVGEVVQSRQVGAAFFLHNIERRLGLELGRAGGPRRGGGHTT